MRIFLFLLCSSILNAKPLKVEVSAPSAIVMNAETGAILYAKNIHEKQHPASITKIATALYVLEKKGRSLDAAITVSSHALSSIPAHVRQAPNSSHPSYRLEHDGTKMHLLPGEILPMKSLLHGLLLSSGNDAANVLAESVSGTIDQFMEELQQFIEQKGMKETHFTNPHGLHHHEHWTTAYDMAQITQMALKNSTFRDIVKSTRYLCPQTNKQPSRYLTQSNRLLKAGPYFYPRAIGVKTGYVAKAGFTLVGAATHEGRTLIAVLLNCAESTHRFRDSIKLFDAAFSEKLITRTLFAKEGDTFAHPIRGATAPLDANLKEDLILSYFPAEEPAYRAEIHWNKVKLPIKAQENVGVLQLVANDGKILHQLSLFASHDVHQKWWSSAADFCQVYKRFLLVFFLGGQVVLFLFYFLKKNQKVGQG